MSGQRADLEPRTARVPTGAWLAVALLAAATFVVGTSELIVTGILPTIADDLGVPIASAGYLVTAYALAYAVVTPVVAAITGAASRRLLLLGCLVAFAAGNALALAAPTFEVLLVARVITAAAAGVFEVVATAAAAAAVPERQRGRAVALVIGGFSVALLLGVPLGTLIGLSLGWRATFAVLVVLGAVAVLGLWFVRLEDPAGATSKASLLAVLRRPVLRVLLTTTIAFVGIYVVWTFMAVFLETVTRLPPQAVAGMLLLVGLGALVGNAVGGLSIDRLGARQTVMVGLAGLMVSMIGTSLLGSVPAAIAACWTLNGVSGGMFVPAQQARLIRHAPHAPELALAINLGGLNVGISAGAALASAIVERGGLVSVGYVAAVFVALALVLVGATRSEV